MGLSTYADRALMGRALRLAALGRHASPNPMVGCVIASAEGRVLGEGYHAQAGEPHAEVFALRGAGEAARGATAYVTLEPCAHHGRTPPCADALAAAGIRRVVAALQDPDARVAGEGIRRLREGGVDVIVGLCASEAARLNAAYLKQRTTGLPYVVVKIAMTLDGRIATASGDSRWISSTITRLWVHRQLRDRADAILVGVGTVLADDPRLTTRLANRIGRNPTRIVVDSRLRTPTDSALAGLAGDGKTWIAHTEEAKPKPRRALARCGVKLIPCPADNDGRVSLPFLLSHLGSSAGFLSVVVEGGSELIASFLAERSVDRYIACLAPRIIGGTSAPGPVGGSGLGAAMPEALRLPSWFCRRSGPDLVIDCRFSELNQGIMEVCSPE